MRSPISGSHAHRSVHGAINVWSGDLIWFINNVWDAVTQQVFLRLIRSHWRGWHIVLFEDRGQPHTAYDSLDLAATLAIQIRLLPRATSELNAMDHLWRQTKPQALAIRATQAIAKSAMQLCDDIYALSPRECLQKAGVLSGNFWLAP